MKTRIFIISVLVGVAMLFAACTEKENNEQTPVTTRQEQRLTVTYTVDATPNHVTLKSIEAYRALVGDLVGKTREGSEIGIVIDNIDNMNLQIVATKANDTVLVSDSLELVMAWVERMNLNGYEVLVRYDETTGTYHCKAQMPMIHTDMNVKYHVDIGQEQTVVVADTLALLSLMDSLVDMVDNGSKVVIRIEDIELEDPDMSRIDLYKFDEVSHSGIVREAVKNCLRGYLVSIFPKEVNEPYMAFYIKPVKQFMRCCGSNGETTYNILLTIIDDSTLYASSYTHYFFDSIIVFSHGFWYYNYKRANDYLGMPAYKLTRAWKENNPSVVYDLEVTSCGFVLESVTPDFCRLLYVDLSQPTLTFNENGPWKKVYDFLLYF